MLFPYNTLLRRYHKRSLCCLKATGCCVNATIRQVVSARHIHCRAELQPLKEIKSRASVWFERIYWCPIGTLCGKLKKWIRNFPMESWVYKRVFIQTPFLKTIYTIHTPAYLYKKASKWIPSHFSRELMLFPRIHHVRLSAIREYPPDGRAINCLLTMQKGALCCV